MTSKREAHGPNKITLWREKCHFGLDTVKCFGHIFSERGKEIDPERKETNQVMGGFEGLREVELFRGSGFDPSCMNLCEG